MVEERYVSDIRVSILVIQTLGDHAKADNVASEGRSLGPRWRRRLSLTETVNRIAQAACLLPMASTEQAIRLRANPTREANPPELERMGTFLRLGQGWTSDSRFVAGDTAE